MEAADHGKVVLGAILAGRPDLLDAARRHLNPGHFTDTVQHGLWLMLERYADQAGGVLPRSALADILRSAPPGSVLRYEEYFDLLAGIRPSDDDFRWSVQQLRELHAERMTGEQITRAMQILTQGAVQDGPGGKRELRGHADARRFLLEGIADIDRELAGSQAPEGDICTEVREIKEDYIRRVQQRAAGTGILTGIPSLDARLGGGIQPGELGIVAGYTSAGKSRFMQFAAHDAVVRQGKKVVIFTSETLRSQYRFAILARHSCEEKFGICDDRGRPGINTRDMKAGTLPDTRAFGRVLDDFASYRGCYIAQVPRGATVASLESRLALLARDWTADLVIIDYLALLRSETRYRDRRESLVEIIQAAGDLATTYCDGLGVPVLSPWQIRRESRDEASRQGYYTLNSLSETAEASNRARVVISLLEPDNDDSRGRSVPLKAQVLKNSDGERGGEPVELRADYATAYFAEAASSISHDGLLEYEESGFQ